ncbi:hypothetical protein LB543_24245 [Mesorhizobium sp. ESP7-2]|uniref:hypothetical protein n=1 Tax=Mesorhizobium sp. ESP7-2 TaxID=2876622 RepID=UPI001CC9EB93|nr:hypothetical protein [Mesorhizobium sp. ESP7-2]MBZ9709825.1 hypothetical protein [Mesorhizobium sp. ESP7-2]
MLRTDNGAALRLSDFASPSDAADAAIDLYGPEAQTAAAYCAMEAHFAGRLADFHLWCAVFQDLSIAKIPKIH